MAKVITDDIHYTQIANALRQATGGNETYQPSQMAEAVEQVRQAQWSILWDAILNGGNMTQDTMGVFSGSYWTDENFYPKYDIVPLNGTYLFKDCRITDLRGRLEALGRRLDVSRVSNFYAAFQNSAITRLPALDMRAAANITQTFYGCQNLQSIQRLILSPVTTYSATFTYCRSLEELTVEGTIGKDLDLHYSTLLTHGSLLSILAALEEKTSGTFTLNLGQANLDKLTAEEKALATNKGWTLL